MENNEIKFVINNFMFNLLGLSKRNIDSCKKNEEIELLSNAKDSLFFQNDSIFFHAPYSKDGFKISSNSFYKNINYQIEQQVFESLLTTSETFLKGLEFSDEEKKMIYKSRLEKRLIASLINKEEKEVESIIELIQKLKLWSLKSYEGKKVPFAFIIDTTITGTKELNYLSFLDSDFSATITDGISSIISLDLECNFIKYHSIIEKEIILSANLDSVKGTPLRFGQILKNYVLGNRLGIFLLTNGDILLAKNSEILFVHRNNQWINFSGQKYVLMLQTIALKEKLGVSKENLMSIFSTILDVSFSHSGGIIAIVKKDLFNKESILSCLDDFTELYDKTKVGIEEYREKAKELYKNEFISKIGPDKKISSLTREQEKHLEREFEKRFSKRMAIETLLISAYSNGVSFYELNRKLRSELVGMDGATILDENGKIIAVGAIIQNDKGSSGGGRGAASSKLSNYGGFASKISTDGYIELYSKGDVLYQIK